ncbi:hypothetical protein [Falsiroseomonas sp. HW251]|uniref:hypothetical protein n=1 Tax=Falsiroseomonas sp. HW251 TaxID=3390998 RepID=UPI003D31F9F2
MRALLAVGLAALLAACGRGGPEPAPMLTDDPAAMQECRAEARNSQQVRDVQRTAWNENLYRTDIVNRNLREAEANAELDCLRRRGVVRGGGVEQVRPPALF